jgi:hypothetical protein
MTEKMAEIAENSQSASYKKHPSKPLDRLAISKVELH